MATFRGISAIGTGVLALLSDAWTRSHFETTVMGTMLCRSQDLTKPPLEFGVSLYVFRVAVNGTQRTLPPSRPGHRRPLPVEVDFILTPWASSAQRELELLGWCMRAMEDDTVLTPAILNAAVPAVFGPQEIVEIAPSALSVEEHLRLWDTLPFDYQLSAAYTARVVRLESDLELVEAGPVLERELDFGVLVQP